MPWRRLLGLSLAHDARAEEQADEALDTLERVAEGLRKARAKLQDISDKQERQAERGRDHRTDRA